MLFNSLQFAIFFIIVYSLYWILSHKWQNRMLLVASCIFYGAWDWRFLFLMFISITTDYICGIKIYESNDEKRRKLFLLISIFVNLSILAFFKYFNFFASNLLVLLKFFGLGISIRFLHIILPVGISFYTFQAMSYALDIYRRKLKPTRSFRDYALFVTYFPQLVAGPIMRAADLLPQVCAKRRFRLDWFYEGCYLIFWGLFQKVFVADNLAKIVDPIFASSQPYNGPTVLLALYAFAFQIYCDFAGYSNIAMGLGRCMGFNIMINFNLPYFSTNPKEFWQRWHISLSSWFRDYVYISMGGNRKGKIKTCRNLLLTMFLAGLWHGAAWTYVIWGVYHSFLAISYNGLMPIFKKVPSPKRVLAKHIWFIVRAIFFFHLVCVGWLIFRATSIAQFFSMLTALVFNFHFTFNMAFNTLVLKLISYLFILVVVQLFQYYKKDLMAVYNGNIAYRALLYIVCFYLIMTYGVLGGKEFIYFQF